MNGGLTMALNFLFLVAGGIISLAVVAGMIALVVYLRRKDKDR